MNKDRVILIQFGNLSSPDFDSLKRNVLYKNDFKLYLNLCVKSL